MLLKIITGALFLLIFTLQGSAQNNKLSIFLDCQRTWCDLNFIRTEVNVVDYYLDRTKADVHVLITQQRAGTDRQQIQVIFFGMGKYQNISDTLIYVNKPNATEDERRRLMVTNLKIGLLPYLMKSGYTGNIDINLQKEVIDAKDSGSIKKDPWKYWVFRVGADGNLSGDNNYKSISISGNFSVNRVTEKYKTFLFARLGYNENQFIDGNDKITIANRRQTIQYGQTFGIDEHWSWGVYGSTIINTFSNYKLNTTLKPVIEYSITSYKDFNTQAFTISYEIGPQLYSYFDTTIYLKTKETLGRQTLIAHFNTNKKWGSISTSMSYSNFLQNFKYFNLNSFVNLSINIKGNITLFGYGSYNIIRDQFNLRKGNASSTDILTRQRQLATGYEFFSGFGISYRFGSKLNNFVNPRLTFIN